MTSRDIRKTFLDFFESKGHSIVPSAPMVIKDDPTLMFTNAGMNQFKDVILGNVEPKSQRVVDSQKCLRVSGKHNDLEEVGVDTYHHTMFEMLGNWSFGDYFKKEAIEWAWELLTDVYKIDKDRLYVTVFEGDDFDGLPRDEEAEKIWLDIVPKDRILSGDKKDNFWEMGDTGPCGPASEIHVDLRSDEERKKVDAKTLVNQDHPQVIEIWNLVFMEKSRKADGSLVNLPAKHIDTGMGFERLAVALQDKKSNYDTDIFTPLIEAIEKISSKKYGRSDSKQDVAFRVISDHVRAVAFAVADGQMPSNTGAGYVIRRILRRAIRYGYSYLGMKEPFIYKLVDVLERQMGEFFPELNSQKKLVEKAIKEEEESFLRTLDKGIDRLEQLIASTRGKQLDGKAVFELYDTYGFPVDLTALIAAESGMEIDQKAFEKHLEEQKDRSRAATKIEAGDWVVVRPDEKEDFVGYDQLSSEVNITRYREVKAKKKTSYQLVFDRTPFYAEGGGQIGDAGVIQNEKETIRIVDTKKENNLIIHFAEKLPKNPEATFQATVDRQRRNETARNHTATHLLHQALREVLGDHVEQKGSLVHPDYLRFDFSHFSKVTDEELDKVEQLVNRRIRENHDKDEYRAVPIEEAKEMGAMMLFGEKYGDLVRVIGFGESRELCGGTHLPATGNIGFFKITNETSVASGIRRVEAVTGERADEFVKDHEKTLNELKQMIKGSNDLPKAVSDLISKNEELTKTIEKLNREKAKNLKGELQNEFEELSGVKFLSKKIDLSPADVKDLVFQLKNERQENLFVIFGTEQDGKALLTCGISENLVKEKGLHAGNIVRELAKEIQGGGGGQPFFATAGGKNPEGLASALSKAKQYLS
ncbi:alanine--tRNA ligase [Halocola ammonii]